MGAIASAIIWTVIGGSFLVAAVRLTGVDDRTRITIAAVGLIPVLFLPAYAFLVVGLVGQRWALAACAGVLIVAHLAWTLPEVLPHGGRAVAGTRLRIFSQNVLFTNSHTEKVASEIRRTQPNVVLLIELSAKNLPDVEPALTASQYPYRFLRPGTNGAFGFGLWSSEPLS